MKWHGLRIFCILNVIDNIILSAEERPSGYETNSESEVEEDKG